LIDKTVGRALSRDLDVAPGEAVEDGLDAFIRGRDRQRRREEGDKRQAEAWKESTRRYNAARAAEIREAWCAHHEAQAARLKATLEDLVRHHELEAQKLGG